MAKFDIFVGRKQELTQINEWAERRNTTHVIAIQGDGGVGKTWLLREIQRRCQEQDKFLVVYWDYAEHPTTGLLQIADLYHQLGIKKSQFLDDLTELEGKAYDLLPAELEKREDQLFQTSVDELSPLLQDKRLIYLTDTTEFMTVSTGRTDQYASQLPNTLVIAAGRNVEQEKLPLFQEIYSPQNVTYIPLDNFSEMESKEFFGCLDQEDFITADIRDKLYFLTAGRPILLSLAVEWLSRDVPLPEIAERSLNDLETLPGDELKGLREQFEFELVDQVRSLKGSLDRVVLYMAHVSRRTDLNILSTLLAIPTPDAQTLMEQLRELSFVKYNPSTDNCMLHDEMGNLVNKHAWPYVDPTGDERRKLARRVIANYYEPRIRELAQQAKAQLESDKGPVRRASIGGAEWELWRLEAERLHYTLEINEQEGSDYFNDRFAQAQRNNHLMRMQFLLGEMEIAGHTGIRDTLELRKAEALRLGGKAEQAIKICQAMLAKSDLASDNRISAHNILGLIAASTDPEQARGHYEAALQIAQSEGKTKTIGALHNNLGQLHLLTSHLDLAIDHYQKATEYSKRADNRPLVASAANNLAYVYRLQGKLAQADVLCRVAMAQRKQMGLERDLAYSYLTKGEIDRDKGDLESAERYTKLALRSFDKVSEVRGQIMAYGSLANIRRHLEQYEQAEAYLQRGIKLAEQIRDEPLLADLLNVYGREQRDRAVYLQEIGDGETEIVSFFQNAEKHLEKSLEMASKYGDRWLITRSHFELALAYFLSGSRPSDYVNDLLDRVWEQAGRLNYGLLQGYVQETRGEIAQREGDYNTAARHFGLAAQLIAQQHGREPERFFDRLSDQLLNPNLPAQATQTLAQGILDVIGEPPSAESLLSLQMLCRQVLDLPIT